MGATTATGTDEGGLYPIREAPGAARCGFVDTDQESIAELLVTTIEAVEDVAFEAVAVSRGADAILSGTATGRQLHDHLTRCLNLRETACRRALTLRSRLVAALSQPDLVAA